MYRLFLFAALAMLSLHAASQSRNDNEIVAEGSAKMKISPDISTFTLKVEKRDSVEKEAIKLLNIEIDDLVKSLYKIGFTSKSIKISGYDVTSERNNDEKKIYSASNSLKLEFKLDTKLINALYAEIQEAGLKDLDISFETKLSDSLEKASRTTLVKLAIEDAKINAKNITLTLNVKLLGVKQVLKYRDGALGPSETIKFLMLSPPKIFGDTDTHFYTSFDKFQVEEVELEEKITIVYAISN